MRGCSLCECIVNENALLRDLTYGLWSLGTFWDGLGASWDGLGEIPRVWGALVGGGGGGSHFAKVFVQGVERS